MRDVEKYSIRYSLLYKAVKFYFHLFYRKVIVIGKENIPGNVPVIYASNHQNALMDALAMLFAVNRPVVFLARADIFKNKRTARFLNFLKILPVYRIRDGIETMGKNSETFDKTVQVLQSNTPIGILPEGTHTNIKHLETLKKGICRIAFQAAESSEFKLDIHIVPVGIDYTNYQNAGTHLLLNYGNPIKVSGYYDLYHVNPQKAIAQLRDDLAIAIKKVMIHVEDKANYHTIQALTGILVSGYLKDKGLVDNRVNRFTASHEIIERVESASSENKIDLNQIGKEIAGYQKLLDQKKLKDKLLESAPPSTWSLAMSVLLSVLLSPIHLYGMIISYLPYKIPALISGKMKDSQFVSSVSFVLSFVLFLFWYVLLFSALLVFSVKLLPALFIALTWPLTGLFTFYNYIYLRKLGGKIRLLKLKHSHPEKYRQLVNLRNSLSGLYDILFLN
jgi:1-acyl-sn-glycerol-3-phosphate acyltransferase